MDEQERGTPVEPVSADLAAVTAEPAAAAAPPHVNTEPGHGHGHGLGMGALALGALGIVYGDIGTSPLYAFRESFDHHHLEVNRVNAFGVVSVVFWALVIIISIKYLYFVMRADNRGEGGILALTALEMPKSGRVKGFAGVIIALGVFGTALLYGDGLITPAISVLGAVEGFEVAFPAFHDYLVPVACVILACLFFVQKRGTGGIGRVFGPIMIVWFSVIGLLGLRQIIKLPSVLKAINPMYAFDWFQADPGNAFLTLGSIFLVVTGGEALYADMGHFGRKPIQLTWYVLVLPCLLLNYFGQAALLASTPGEELGNPFYRLAPEWAVTPLTFLATMAAIIASQALISGAFSLTAQAVQLDYLPRISVRHTSSQHQGQIYVPLVNWLLMIGCLGLVILFRTSSNLAAAYGIAVTTTMAITTMLFYFVARHRFGWSQAKALAICLPGLIIDLAFMFANVPKIPDGGWFPLVIAALLVAQMTTWRRGRQLVADRIQRGEHPVENVLQYASTAKVQRVGGTAVYMFKDAGKAPPALITNLRHNKVLHRRTLLVSVEMSEVPRISRAERLTVTRLVPGVFQIVIRFGFMEEPDVPWALALLDEPDLQFRPDETTYFIGREIVTSSKAPGMHPLREELFVLLNRGAASASRFFNLPPERVFEVGSFVEI